MPTTNQTPDHNPFAGPSPSTSTSSSAVPQRVLACVLCQQRKIRCDRKFPCATCIKAKVQCVPATLATRQRRRRFAERDLLDRLRHYESILRSNKINFEPLHPSLDTTTADEQDKDADEARSGQKTDGQSNTLIKNESVFEAKYAP